MKTTWLFPALVLPLTLVACSDPPPPKGTAGSATAPSSAKPKVASPHPTPPPNTDKDARAVLDRWVAAQNEGKLDAYTALYAPKFEGVRRSGPRTARLDRTRWMKEREGMFQKKMEVKVSDVNVVPSLGGAIVTFKQSWTSGTYSDEGPKRLTLVRSGSALLIGREEMLASSLKKPEQAAPLAADKLAFVVRAPTPMVVLDGNAKNEWGDAVPWLVTRGDVVTTRRTVDAAKLPKDLAAWRGKRLELFGKSGKVCEANVTSFGLVGRVTPHFGMVALWEGKGEGGNGKAMGDGDIAQDAWALAGSGSAAPGGRLLVGQLFTTNGKCDDAIWGRVAPEKSPLKDAKDTQGAKAAPDKKEPPKAAAGAKAPPAAKDAKDATEPAPMVDDSGLSMAEAKPADDATRTTVLAELRKLPAWAEIQKDYEAEKAAGDAAKWDEGKSAKAQVFVMELPGGLSLVTASVTVNEGCSTFGATLSAIWELKAGKLTLVRDADGEALLPLSAGDVDGDGRPEILLEEGVLRSSGTRYDRWDRLTIPFLDCGC